MKSRKPTLTKKQLGATLAVLIVAGLGFGFWAFQIKTNAYKLQELVESDSKKAGLNAYIEVSANPDQFGWMITTGGNYNAAKLCFVEDQDGFIYIAQINNNIFEKMLASPDLASNPFVLTGITKTITEDMKELTIPEWKTRGKTVTLEDFDDRFGYVYLDTRSGYDDEIQIAAAIVCAISSFVTVFYLIKAPKIKKMS